MTDVNWLLVGDAEVNPYHRPFIAPPQFADRVMPFRRILASCDSAAK